MLEAELFGFEAGAFTDAKRSKPGLFEAASGGTLFLDEIDSLSPPVQSKVLKVIEEKQVRRLGAVESRVVDVKLIAATQRDLKQLAAGGGFRADLYHRLAVLVLALPPLRARPLDVDLLADHFLRSYAEAHGLPPRPLTAEARAWLAANPWPGNVRELSHLMERATLLCDGDEIDAAALAALADPLAFAASADAVSPEAAAEGDATGAEEIRAALAKAGGNVVRAARLLGIGRNALRYRMRRLGIARPAFDDAAPPVVAARPADAGPSAAEPPPAPAPAAEPPPLEQKSVALLAISLAFDAESGAGYEPWTESRRCERAVAERIEGFGGLLVQRTPARLTAAFGIPRALEQTAQRAVQAALAARRAVSQSPGAELRAAVHVGEVRFDAGAGDPATACFPVGDVWVLPERLLGHAGRGEVLISAPTARRLADGFLLQERAVQLGPREQDRVVAHAVLHPQPRPASAAAAAGGSEFVGRRRELDLLADAFERAVEGHGQVVLLAGEAGIGKSRLLAELRARLRGRPHRWIEGHCASYGATTPFLPLIDALRRDAGIDDRDDDASAATKIDASVAALGPDLALTLPFVKQLLSLEIGDDSVRALDSASRRSELFRALRALTLRAAEHQPLVVVVEDLHWADSASTEWLAFLADVIPTTRAMLVVSYRTGLQSPFPDRSYQLRITLAPLSGADMSVMAGTVLGTNDCPEALQGLIAAKAEGNPFFIEELLRSLLEDGTLRRENGRVVLTRALEDLSVPDTVQDVLIARIDRLPADARAAIQVASVIGREFALRLLTRIADAGQQVHTQVEELRSLELIYEKALHPELAYMFKHALTHDVAYESVIAERRRRLHATIGAAIEELYADRLPEHYETLAHHYGRAGDAARALHYHEHSAEKAAETYANRAVVHHSRAALALTEQVNAPQDVVRRLNERLALAHFYLSEYTAAAAAYEAAAAHGPEDEARALYLSHAGYAHFWGHRYDAARRCGAEAITLARQRGFGAAEGLALALDGFFLGVHDADLAGYERQSRRALEIGLRHGHRGVEAFGHFQLTQVAEWCGDYRGAIAHAERARALGRELKQADVLIFATWFLGKARCCTGDYGGAIALLQDAYELCDRIGDRAWKSRMLNTLGWCLGEIGATQRARDVNARAAALAREIGDPEILANADINLAYDHLALGDRERAGALLEPLESAVARPGDPWMRWRYTLHLRDARGRLELRRGEPERALAAAEDELAGARRHRAPKIEGRALALRAAALLGLDRRDEAAAAARAAMEGAEQIGYRRGVWSAHGLLAELARRAGREEEAARHREAARAAADACARTLRDETLRRTLTDSAGAGA
jgi:transcriptional regulator with AAA-type ATPase domain/tetratricopeptide (TPR) repeat protein